jgi:hypothetical protein
MGSFTILVAWYLMLGAGKPAWLAGLGGILLPVLVFFTLQQMGSLADSIGQELTFTLTSDNSKAKEQAEGPTDLEEEVQRS